MKISIFSYAKIHILAGVVLLGLLSGCATVHEQGITTETKEIDLKGNGLVLMTLLVDNQFKPSYQPEVLVTHIETPNADSKEQRHNFKTDKEGAIATTEGTRYFLRMELPPGEYVVRGATCMYRSLLIVGTCIMPIHADITVTPDSITYVGHARGVTRERNKNEFRAGSLIPLIDQSVTGFSRSTFDVTIQDDSEKDMKTFRSLFPALATAQIDVKLLPPFDRQRAQIWWESDGRKDGAADSVSIKGENNSSSPSL